MPGELPPFRRQGFRHQIFRKYRGCNYHYKNALSKVVSIVVPVLQWPQTFYLQQGKPQKTHLLKKAIRFPDDKHYLFAMHHPGKQV